MGVTTNKIFKTGFGVWSFSFGVCKRNSNTETYAWIKYCYWFWPFGDPKYLTCNFKYATNQFYFLYVILSNFLVYKRFLSDQMGSEEYKVRQRDPRHHFMKFDIADYTCGTRIISQVFGSLAKKDGVFLRNSWSKSSTFFFF